LALAGLGVVLFGLGWFGDSMGWPIIKRIWTPTWALYSTGICCWILAALYGVIDVLHFRAWSYFLVVVGMNSIAIYMMGQLLRGWTAGQLKTHFGSQIFTFLGPAYEPMLTATLVGCVFWLVCFWMMRQRIFIRV
jgi:predicted acyltransferase